MSIDTPTRETQLALEEAQTRQNLVSFVILRSCTRTWSWKRPDLLRSPANAERLSTALACARLRDATGPQSLDELRREMGLDEGI